MQTKLGIAHTTGYPQLLRIYISTYNCISFRGTDHRLELRTHAVLLGIACCQPRLLNGPARNSAHGNNLGQDDSPLVLLLALLLWRFRLLETHTIWCVLPDHHLVGDTISSTNPIAALCIHIQSFFGLISRAF